MHRAVLILIVLFISNFITTYSQITEEEYIRESTKLKLRKDQLINEIENIKFEIANMSNIIPDLEQKVITSYRELYVLKYGREVGEKISHKQIWTGMTDEMVRDSWGEPDKIDKNAKPWGIFTQWYYCDVTFFFRDGKLTEWDEE